MRRPSTLLWFVVGALLTGFGWWTFHFLCDDAYIAFRYVRMAYEGHGYTWNAPPFRPVEGYTSFLWVVLLDLAWRGLGVPPTTSANALSLGFSLVSLGLVLRLAARVTRALPSREQTAWMGLLTLLVCTNRTWLTWTTGGLETALWTACLLLWIDQASRTSDDRPALLRLMGSAALLPLVRPDGLLYLALTPLLVALRQVRGNGLRIDVLLPLPYLLPLAHIAWRFATYGAWLPNTYYAKVTEPWPLMGVLFAALFSWEYVLWPIVLLLGWAIVRKREMPVLPALTIGIVLTQLLFHLRGGGDHFEYRLFVHWVPLAWLAMPWVFRTLQVPLRRALLLTTLLGAAGHVLPWTHFFLTTGSGQTFWEHPHQAVAPSVPAVLRPYAEVKDWVSRWQQYHLVGTPHHIHVAFLDVQERRFPGEGPFEVVGDVETAVWAHSNPGYAAYHLPQIAVLDLLGLNDGVVARTPVPPVRKRKLAHERLPPPGYVQCYSPNVTVTQEQVVVHPRETPLSLADLAACEDLWWGRARKGELPPGALTTTAPPGP